MTFKFKEASSVNWGASKLGCQFEALKFNTLITRAKSIDTVERNPNNKVNHYTFGPQNYENEGCKTYSREV